jgi:hypothetical protein
MRLYANKKLSLSLSDHGVVPFVQRGREKVASGDGMVFCLCWLFISFHGFCFFSAAIPCVTEEDIFKILRLPYIPPEKRDEIPSEMQT